MSDEIPDEVPEEVVEIVEYELEAPVGLDGTAPLTVPAVAPTQPVGPDAIEQLLADSLRPRSRPRRMTEDVWAIQREYTEEGGMLDLAEDVASLTELEQLVRGNSAVGLSKKVNLVGNIVSRRIQAKQAHMKIQKDLELVITHDQFTSLLEDFTAVLVRHLGDDPALMKRIGVDIGKAVRRWRGRVG